MALFLSGFFYFSFRNASLFVFGARTSAIVLLGWCFFLVSFLLFPALRGKKKREQGVYVCFSSSDFASFVQGECFVFCEVLRSSAFGGGLGEKQEIQTETVSLFFVFVFFLFPGFLLLFEVVLHCFVVAFLVSFVAVIRLLLLLRTVVSGGGLFTPNL